MEQAPLLPLGPSPKYSITVQPPALPHPGEHLRLRPLLRNSCAETKKKKKLAQMKEQLTAPEQIQLRDRDSQPIRCTVQNSGNQDAQNWLSMVAK